MGCARSAVAERPTGFQPFIQRECASARAQCSFLGEINVIADASRRFRSSRHRFLTPSHPPAGEVPPSSSVPQVGATRWITPQPDPSVKGTEPARGGIDQTQKIRVQPSHFAASRLRFLRHARAPRTFTLHGRLHHMTPGGGASAILRAVEGHEWRSGARAPAGERLAQKTEEVEQSPSKSQL
jgi:hypothetical protein